MIPGEIYRHDAFYRNPETGELNRKYLVVLARTPGDDIVARLLTSRANARPEDPKCYHGLPYPGFYLGVIGDPLPMKSWLDLRYLDDLDRFDAGRLSERGVIGLVATLHAALLVELLDCAARADDTTRLQERAIRDQMARMHA